MGIPSAVGRGLQLTVDTKGRVRTSKEKRRIIHWCSVTADRLEPRVLKRRPKPYQVLNRHRSAMKEIPHRDKYRKPL